MKRFVPLVVSAACFFAVPALAHHSLAAYNRSATKTITGTVRDFEWTNPHAKLVLTVTGDDGTSKRWNFEGGSISRLVTQGFVQDAIVLGRMLIVSYNPNRDGSPGGFFVGVTTEDGKTYGTVR